MFYFGAQIYFLAKLTLDFIKVEEAKFYPFLKSAWVDVLRLRDKNVGKENPEIEFDFEEGFLMKFSA